MFKGAADGDKCCHRQVIFERLPLLQVRLADIVMFVSPHTCTINKSLLGLCEEEGSHVRPYKVMLGGGYIMGGDCLTSRHVTL